jgi:hypothetical protein
MWPGTTECGLELLMVKTFSIGFPDAGYYDEREHARKIASLFSTTHHEYEVNPQALEILPLLLKFGAAPKAVLWWPAGREASSTTACGLNEPAISVPTPPPV